MERNLWPDGGRHFRAQHFINEFSSKNTIINFVFLCLILLLIVNQPIERKPNILQTMLNVNIHVHRHAQRIDWFFFYSGCIVHVNCEDE